MSAPADPASPPLYSNDVDMEVDHFTNGVTELSSNGFLNGTSKHATEPEDCDADMGGCRGGASCVAFALPSAAFETACNAFPVTDARSHSKVQGFFSCR